MIGDWRLVAQPEREIAGVGVQCGQQACLTILFWQNEIVVGLSRKRSTISCKNRYPSPMARPDPFGVGPFASAGRANGGISADFGPSGAAWMRRQPVVETLTCANGLEMAIVCASGAMKTGETFWQTRSNSRSFWSLSQHFPLAVRLRSNARRPALSAALLWPRFWARISVRAPLSAVRPVALAPVPSIRARRAASRHSQPSRRSFMAAVGQSPGGSFVSDRT